MNPLATSKDQLTDSLLQLSSNWESAKEVWNDAAKRDFEKEFWTEFEATSLA